MKSVLISIQPKWCELIANGKKTVEVRKTNPKLETPFKVYIYCTKNKEKRIGSWLNLYCDSGQVSTDIKLEDVCYQLNGKVIGEFVCDVIYETELIEERQTVARHYPRPWWYNGADDCLHHTELENYLQGKTGYGWHISNLVIYDKPRELSEFRSYNIRAYFDEEIKLPMPTHEITRPPRSWCYVESEVTV